LPHSKSDGFTLLEVLIAMAITAFVAITGYTTLSTVIIGVDSQRSEAVRLHEVNRALTLISRDIRQLVNRPVRDEFGQLESSLTGGDLAREMLSLTHAGWHNTVSAPRSGLQRVSYRLEDGRLQRLSWPVLDRSSAIDPQVVELLSGVEFVELLFLPALSELNIGRGVDIDRRQWQSSWVSDVTRPNATVNPPAALELILSLEDWGEVHRIYALPSYPQ
tara:strand:- start:706 stop:1362 length:657 start_codon:yes stop_codon:yes gene_type:complete